LSDWHSYDEIADVYDRAWGSRFEAVARAMAAMLPDSPLQTTLDIGTGTGIVPTIFSESLKKPRVSVGCDLSLAMLRQAKKRLPVLQVVAADALALPFETEVFDLATASFVLSHLRSYREGLVELRRVLKPSGFLAVSNWRPADDEYSRAWNEFLAAAISKQEADRALEEVAPSEIYLSQAQNLESALSDSGFSIVRTESVDLRFQLTIEQYIEDREINSGGRLGRHILGAGKWAEFRTRVKDALHHRFGESVQYSRRALIVTARRTRA
jgi:ubiquinone/menaquinone biosynthesis C-methylase UbiE